MGRYKCCVGSCTSASETHRLFRFPKNDCLRNLWMSFLVPTNSSFIGLTSQQLSSKRVCEKHFDHQFDAEEGQKKMRRPTRSLSNHSLNQSLNIQRGTTPEDEDGDLRDRVIGKRVVSSPCSPTDNSDSDGDEYQTDRSLRGEERYEQEGEVENARKAGTIRDKVKLMIAKHGRDVITLVSRRVQVDLSYLRSLEEIERTKVILERVIGVYTQIPGVDSSRISEKGILKFKVSNQYLSPDSDSSEPQVPSKSSTPRQAQQKKHSYPFILKELVEGIIIPPKFPRLPHYIMKYGSSGVTEEGVAAIRIANPGSSVSELLKQILIHN